MSIEVACRRCGAEPKLAVIELPLHRFALGLACQCKVFYQQPEVFESVEECVRDLEIQIIEDQMTNPGSSDGPGNGTIH